MKNRKKLFWVISTGLAAGAAAYAYFNKKRGNKAREGYMLSGDDEDEMFFEFSGESCISPEDAESSALNAAREKLGAGASIASASDNKALTVNIGGNRRHCYMFGAVADDLSINPQTLLFYVDAVTGEVFESNE